MIKRILISFKRNWLLFIVVFFFIGSIISFEVVSNNVRTQRMITDVSSQLTTMAGLKAVQIQNWRSERIIDGQTIQTDVQFSNDINQLMNDPSEYRYIRRNLDRLRTLLLDPNYSSIMLLNPNGDEKLHVGVTDNQAIHNIDEIIDNIIITHEIELSNLYVTANGSVKMDMVIPVFQSGDQTKPIIAFLVYSVTPDTVLYPLIQSLPTTFATAETLLVRKENEEAVYLNELRFMSGSELTLRVPLTHIEVPAVMAANGITGIVRGKDYRSVPVMASIVPIEGTDWKLIAKVDLDEINFPIRQQLFSTILTAIFLVIAGLVSVSVLWRRQSATITKGLSVSENLRKNLEEKYYTLFNQANDAILLVEENGKILEANSQAVKMYGYTQEELLKLKIGELRDSSTKPSVPTDMEQVKNGSANLFETIHKRKNGELFHVDVSSQYISIDGKGVFQSLIRDITDKKEAEENLRYSEMALKKAQAVSHVGSWRWNLISDQIELSDELFTIFDVPGENHGLSFTEFEKTFIKEEDFERVSSTRLNAINEKHGFSFETRINRPDKKEIIIRVETGELIFDNQGNLVEVFGVAQDITEMKAAERELRKSENLLQRIYDLLPVGLWLTNEKGELIRSNKMVKQIWGKDILVDINRFEVFHGRRLPSREEIKPEDWASVHTIREGVTIQDEMIEIDAYDGKTKTILNYSTPILDESGKLEGAIVLNMDITELKKAEEQLSAQLDELRRWNMATLGRENRVRDLKIEINALLEKMGEAPKYKSVLEETHE